MAVGFNGKHLAKFIRPEEYEAIYPQVELAHTKQLETKTGVGNDFWVGWTCLLLMTRKNLPKEAAQKIRSDSDCCWSPVSAAPTWVPALWSRPSRGLYHNEVDGGLKIYFCGNTISPTALNDIIKLTKGKRFPSTLSPSPAPPPRRPLPSACCASCWKILSVSRKPTSASTPPPRPR